MHPITEVPSARQWELQLKLDGPSVSASDLSPASTRGTHVIKQVEFIAHLQHGRSHTMGSLGLISKRVLVST